MAVAWFIAPYKRQVRKAGEKPGRYCAMDDHRAAIAADGGAWSESEVLGNCAVVKVRAAAATLTTIAGTQGYQRIPTVVNLTDLLSALNNSQRTALRNRVEAMGYTAAEVTAALGTDWRTRTLGEVLRFCASRRLEPRHDTGTDTIVLDGTQRSCTPIDDVDRMVSNT